MSRGKRGFTLIELLVVIAIIAILAAILFPVFARAREKARANTCLSNMKQLTLGVLMYANDFDERMPPAMAGWANPPGWASNVYPYVRSVQIYQCPDIINQGTQYYNPIPGSSPAANFPKSYNISACGNICGNPPSSYDGRYCRYMAEMPKPAETIVLTEGIGDWTSAYWDQGYAYVAQTKQLWPVHSGLGNYGFVDGHAKAMKPTATNLVQNMWTIEDDGPCTTQVLGQALPEIERLWPGG